MELNAAQIRFKEHLNDWVYCSNDIKNGIAKRKKEDAIKFEFIQPNPIYKKYLAFDIDRKNSVLDWYDLNCPEPTIISVNPNSGHSHYLYELEKPIIFTDNGRKHPKQYYEAVRTALNAKLEGDLGFNGFMLRNPLLRTPPVTHAKKRETYTLNHLSEYIDLAPKIRTNSMGRNCTLFDSLRLEAYKLSRKQPSQEQLFNELNLLANQFNITFSERLPEKELLTICKSVADWVSTRYTGNGLRRGIMNLSNDINLKEKQKLSGQFSARLESEGSAKRIFDTKVSLLAHNPFILNQSIVCKNLKLSKTTVSKHWERLF